MMRNGKNFFFYFRIWIAAVVLMMTAACLFYGCKRGSSGGAQYIVVMDDFKTEYFVGDELDPTGTLKVVYQTDYFGVTPIKEEMIKGFDSSEQGDCFVTVSFAGKSVEVLIRILPLVATSISLDEETLPRVVYKGQAFPEGSTLSATMVNGTVRSGVPITAEMLGSFDSMRLGEQTVTVSYAGSTASFTLTVQEDFVTSIALSGAKTSYSVGEAFYAQGVKVAVHYESGRIVFRPVSEAQITGFSTELGGTFSARVTLLTYSCDYYYSVGKAAVSLLLIEDSLPREFEKGATFPSGGIARVTYDDGTTAEIPVTKADVLDFDTAKAGAHSSSVEMQGQTALYSYFVLKGITQGVPVGYTEAVEEGSSFDGFGMVTITYDDGETENIPFTDPRLTLSYSTSSAGEIRQTVTFRGRTYPFTVTVYAPEERNAVESISLLGTFHPILFGEEPDIEGMMVSVTYKYLDASTVALTRSMLSFDPPQQIAGDYEIVPITIALLGKTDTAEIPILSSAYAARVTSISVYGLPSIVLTGSAADYSSAGMIVTYGGGYRVESEVPLSDATVTGYDTSAAGQMTLTIEYGGAEASETIRVIAAADKDKPTDALVVGFDPVLFVGDSLSAADLSGASVILTLGYGYSETTIALEASMLSGGPFSEAGRATVLFSYQGVQKELSVTVHSEAEKTELTAISCEEIRTTVGVSPDLTKTPLTLEYGYGRRHVYIPLSTAGVEITSFSIDKVGIERVEISYQGKTCSALVAVASAGGEAVVESIEIDPSSKTTFERGSALSGVILSVTYGSGSSSHVNVTMDMVPEFSTENSGDYVITVAYGGRSAVFAYTVS